MKYYIILAVVLTGCSTPPLKPSIRVPAPIPPTYAEINNAKFDADRKQAYNIIETNNAELNSLYARYNELYAKLNNQTTSTTVDQYGNITSSTTNTRNSSDEQELTQIHSQIQVLEAENNQCQSLINRQLHVY